MPGRHQALGPLVVYHGCDRSVAEAVLAGKMELLPSENEYDWLGAGIYFWVASANRGMDWASMMARRREPAIREPHVLGALLYPGLCLNLTDYGAMPRMRDAYRALETIASSSGSPMARNTAYEDGIPMRRALDCSVITMVHRLRDAAHEPPYDTVFGVFEEGEPAYPGAGFRSKTHIQVAVRNTDCIVGYFRVKGL